MAKQTLDTLPVHPDLIIALDYMRSGPPPEYHWFLFVQEEHKDSGRKIDAIHNAAPGEEKVWMFDATDLSLQTSEAVAVAAIIGKVEGISLTDLEETLRKNVPVGQVPAADMGREPKFSCRVWILDALRYLHKEGIIQCSDIDAMEQEMKEYGKAAVLEIDNDTFTVAKLVTAKNSQGSQ